MAKVVWGIELGTTSIKAVKLTSTKEGLEISDLEVQELPEQMDDELEQTREDRLLLALEALKESKSIKGEPVYVSIPGHQSFNRIISLPLLDPKKFRETVKFEAQQQMPISMDEIIWDYQLVDKNPKVGDEVQVSLFAVRKEIVDSYVTLMASAGLNIGGIQVAPLAIYNFIKYDQKFPKSGVVIDIGADNTDVLIIDENRIWIRNVPSGGNAITKTLADRFKIPREEAEKLKVKAAKSKQAQKIFGVMKPALRELLSEINRSLGFYKSQNPKVKINYMMLMGAGAHLLGLKKFFEQQLQFRVDKLSHLKRLQRGRNADPGALNDHITTMAVAMGLGIQGAGVADNRINLIPEAIRTESQQRSKFPIVVVAMVVMALAALLPMFGVGGKAKEARDATKVYKNAINRMVGQQQELDALPPTEPILGVLSHYMYSFDGYELANLVDQALIATWTDRQLRSEIDRYNQRYQPFPESNFDEIFTEFDEDEDGKLSRQEFFTGFDGGYNPSSGRYERTHTDHYGFDFGKADTDSDGFLSEEEAKAMMPGRTRSAPLFVALEPISAERHRELHAGGRKDFHVITDRTVDAPQVGVDDMGGMGGAAGAPGEDSGLPRQPVERWFYRDRSYGAELLMAIPVDFDPYWQASGSSSAANFFDGLKNWFENRLQEELTRLTESDSNLTFQVGVDPLVDRGSPRAVKDLSTAGGSGGSGQTKVAPAGLYCRISLAVRVTWSNPLVGQVTAIDATAGRYTASFGGPMTAVLQQLEARATGGDPIGFILSDGNKSWSVTWDPSDAPRSDAGRVVVPFTFGGEVAAADVPSSPETLRIYPRVLRPVNPTE